jgi:hypothetical protein
MNKKLYLLVLILCLAAIHCAYSVSASAQTDDKILADGNPPLKQSEMNTMIDFYEWALEKDFTPPQRQRFIELSVASYREDVAGSRKGADALFEVFGKVRRLSEDEQQKIREQLKPELIKEFRRENDETSKLLLAVAENSSANNSAEIAEEPNEANDAMNDTANKATREPQNPDESFGGNLSGLSGKWASGSSGSMTKTVSGVYLGGNASRFTYQFSANGSVEYTGIMNMMTAGCRLQVFTSKQGKARLNGDKLTINWSPAAFSRDDSCSPAKNYKKTLPAETEALRVQFKDSYGQKQLCLTGKDETCFSPEN